MNASKDKFKMLELSLADEDGWVHFLTPRGNKIAFRPGGTDSVAFSFTLQSFSGMIGTQDVDDDHLCVQLNRNDGSVRISQLFGGEGKELINDLLDIAEVLAVNFDSFIS